MTEFDPKLVRKILDRRFCRLVNEGVEQGMKLYASIWAGNPLSFDMRRALEDQRDALYGQADRTREVLCWLDMEIEARRTPAERIWLEIEDEPYDPEKFGVQMVRDVLDAGNRIGVLEVKP